MATANVNVVPVEETHISTRQTSSKERRRRHRIKEVRREQGVSLRSAARRMGTDMATIRQQEQENEDLSISDLQRWQQALDVPIEDLLVESDAPLSRPVMERARMVRLMKTTMSIRDKAKSPSMQRMAQTMVEQLIDMMPELEQVTPWHTVGQRRSLDELGRAAECPVSDQYFSQQDSIYDW